MSAHRRSLRVPGTAMARRLTLGLLCCTTAGAAALGISMNPRNAAPATIAMTNTANTLERVPHRRSDAGEPLAHPHRPAAAKPAARQAGAAAEHRRPELDSGQDGQRDRHGRPSTWASAAAAGSSRWPPRCRSQISRTTTHAVDHDSLGLFQQRPSSGWGTPKQLTNPTYAAHAFYAGAGALQGLLGLPDLCRPEGAAQRVPERVRQARAVRDEDRGHPGQALLTFPARRVPTSADRS